jgi:hypothetical protein
MTATVNNAQTNGSQAPVVVEGTTLDYALRHKSARTREKVARDLISGQVNVGRLNRKQAADICRVSYAKLSKKPTKPLGTMMIIAWWNQASPDERAALIRGLGVSQVWDAISAIIG